MEKSTPLLILSSSSPARRELLGRLGLPFISVNPALDETPLPNETVEDLVLRLAEAKAKQGSKNYQNALIIGADQVGVLQETILAKPLTHEKAAKQLSLMSGKKVKFFTGLCVYDARSKESKTALTTYDVYFKTLSEEQIENYLQKEKPYHCAGSFQAEGLGISLVDHFAGDDYTALIGLPLIRLVGFLTATTFDPLLMC